MRGLSLILSLWFLLISVGLTANRHYCKGKLRKVGISLLQKHTECCKKQDMPKDCCKDKYVHLKSDTDGVMAKVAIDIKPATFVVAVVHYLFNTSFAKKAENLPDTYRPPPLTAEIPILNCVFLI